MSQLDIKQRGMGGTLSRSTSGIPPLNAALTVGIFSKPTLDVRDWTCPECGVVHDRDLNAARNIHAVGLTVFEAWEKP